MKADRSYSNRRTLTSVIYGARTRSTWQCVGDGGAGTAVYKFLKYSGNNF